MTLFIIVLTNRKTGRMTLMSSAGETLVFGSYQEATFHAHQVYGANNPNVEHGAFKLDSKRVCVKKGAADSPRPES